MSPLGFSARFGEGRFSRSRFSIVATLYGFYPLTHTKELNVFATSGKNTKEINLYSVAGSYKKDLG